MQQCLTKFLGVIFEYSYSNFSFRFSNKFDTIILCINPKVQFIVSSLNDVSLK